MSFTVDHELQSIHSYLLWTWELLWPSVQSEKKVLLNYYYLLLFPAFISWFMQKNYTSTLVMLPAPAQLTPATRCLNWFRKQVSYREHHLKSYADQAETVLVCLS